MYKKLDFLQASFTTWQVQLFPRLILSLIFWKYLNAASWSAAFIKFAFSFFIHFLSMLILQYFLDWVAG